MSLLCVTVRKARLVGNGGQYNSYATLKLQNVKSTTVAVKGGEPCWEQDFMFETNRMDTGLVVELWNKGMLWDKLIGSHWMPLMGIQYSNEVGDGSWLSLDGELMMKEGEVIGTKFPTGHNILIETHFELPYDLQDGDANELQKKLEVLNSIMNEEISTLKEQSRRTGYLPHSGMSEDSDYTSDINYPIGHPNHQNDHHANSSTSQFRTTTDISQWHQPHHSNTIEDDYSPRHHHRTSEDRGNYDSYDQDYRDGYNLDDRMYTRYDQPVPDQTPTDVRYSSYDENRHQGDYYDDRTPRSDTESDPLYYNSRPPAKYSNRRESWDRQERNVNNRGMNLSRQSTISDQSYSIEMDEYYDNCRAPHDRWGRDSRYSGQDHDIVYQNSSTNRGSTYDRQPNYTSDSRHFGEINDYDKHRASNYEHQPDISYKQSGYYDRQDNTGDSRNSRRSDPMAYTTDPYGERYDYEVQENSQQYNMQYDVNRLQGSPYVSDNRYDYIEPAYASERPQSEHYESHRGSIRHYENEEYNMDMKKNYIDDDYRVQEQPQPSSPSDAVILNDSGYQTMNRNRHHTITSIPSDSIESYTTARYSDGYDTGPQMYPTYPDDYNGDVNDPKSQVNSGLTATTTIKTNAEKIYESENPIDNIPRSEMPNEPLQMSQQDSTDDPYLTPPSVLANRGPSFQDAEPIESNEMKMSDIIASDSHSVPSLAKLRWITAFNKICDQLAGVSAPICSLSIFIK